MMETSFIKINRKKYITIFCSFFFIYNMMMDVLLYINNKNSFSFASALFAPALSLGRGRYDNQHRYISIYRERRGEEEGLGEGEYVHASVSVSGEVIGGNNALLYQRRGLIITSLLIFIIICTSSLQLCSFSSYITQASFNSLLYIFLPLFLFLISSPPSPLLPPPSCTHTPACCTAHLPLDRRTVNEEKMSRRIM